MTNVITFVGGSAAGAGPNGNNVSLTPAPIAGIAVGDLVLIAASIRNVGTGTVDTPVGWVRLTPAGNFALLARFWQTGDAMPTVTFTGGVANADTTSATMALRGVAPGQTTDPDGLTALTNVSAQNVAYPGATITRDNRIAIIAGWKQDDATTWSTPATFTSLGLTSVTAGDDASFKWVYQIQTSAANVAAASFTLTGGAAAVSQAYTLVLRPVTALQAIEQDVWPPRVQLTASSLDVGSSITIFRVVAGQRTAVRGAYAVTAETTALVVVDAELPFGVPVSYVLQVDGADDVTLASTTYSLPPPAGSDVPLVALTDAITAQAAEVRVLSWPERARQALASVFPVDGRNLFVTSGIGQYTSQVELFTDTIVGSRAVEDLVKMATSGIVQVRQGGGYDTVDAYWGVLSAADRRWSQDGSDPRRVWVLDVVEVDGWSLLVEARGFTLQDVADAYTGLTLADLDADYATLLLMAQGDYGV